MGWVKQTNFYSGQGTVQVAVRDALGQPKGFDLLGDVSKCDIAIEEDVRDVKDSQAGQRGIALRYTVETKASVEMTLRNISAAVLQLVLRGDLTKVPASNVVGEAVKLYNGRILKLRRQKTSAVIIKRGATSLLAYVNDATPFDYKLNLDGGSIQMNDGSVAAISALTTGGTVPTAITIGATTSVTVANTAAVGDFVALTGFAGADAALINGKSHKILTATAAIVTLDLNTVGKTITIGVPLSAFDGVALTADYAFALQYQIDALTQTAPERYLLIEGLNTVAGGSPVNVEAFRVLLELPGSLSLIGDENIAELTLRGSILLDALQPVGSQYFRQTLLAA